MRNPDIDTAARVMIYDWQRGRIPYFVTPPRLEENADENESDGEEKVKNNKKHQINSN